MPISTVTNSTQISATLYNTVQQQLEQVIEDFWGADARSIPVLAGTPIDQRFWDDIADDVNRAWAHIKNEDYDIVLGPEVNTGTLIVKEFFNNIIDATNFIASNTTTVHPAQLLKATTATGAAESTRIQSFGSTVTHIVYYQFDNAVEANYFFNLGGSLIASTGYGPEGFTPTISTDTNWIEMITYVNNELQKIQNQFTYTNWINTVSITITTVTNVIIPPSFILPLYYITATFTKVDDMTVDFTQVFGHIGYLSELDLYSTATYQYSIGNAEIQGIGSSVPEIVEVEGLGSGGALVAFPTRYLDYTTFGSNFTWRAKKQSSSQSITLSNTGNLPVIISDIVYTRHGGVVPNVSFSPSVTFPLTLTPGQTLQLTLYYTGTTVGTFNNSVTVICDAYFGNKTIQTTCDVLVPLFDFTLSNTSWSISSNTIIEQFFDIGVRPLEYDLVDGYVAITAGGDGFGINVIEQKYSSLVFDLQNGQTQAVSVNTVKIFRLIWAPGYRNSGTYTGTATVSATGRDGTTLTQTISLSVVYTKPSYANIGKWISPMAKYNSVVGISYDIVAGSRYVTIGIGMGSDGAPKIQNGGADYANVDNLGIGSDSGVNNGYVLYPVSVDLPVGNEQKNALASQYAVWINETGVYPVETDITRTYAFTVGSSESVTVEYAFNDVGWVAIDGNKIADYQYIQIGGQDGEGSYYNYEGPRSDVGVANFYLAAGSHTITFSVNNKGYDETKGWVAIVMKYTNTGIVFWTTTYPQRLAYRGWKQVYRIPLTGNAQSYVAGNYCIKDPQTTNGNQILNDIISGIADINDDGFGNLRITFRPKSAAANNEEHHYDSLNIERSAYYYLPYGERIRQLDGPIGSNQTRFFLGFKANGTHWTSIVGIPGSPDYTFNYPASSGSDRNLLGLAIALGSAILLTGGAAAVGVGIGLLIFLKIICTKLYRLRLIPKDIFEADQRFGKELKEKDPDTYFGYLAWAQIMVNWMDGHGKGPNLWKLLFWIKDETLQIEKWRDWMIKFTCYGGIPWAEEMARRMGVRETSPLAGKFMMTVGLPICKVIGKWRKKFGEPKNPPGALKGLTLLSIVSIMYIPVSILKLIDKIKK